LKITALFAGVALAATLAAGSASADIFINFDDVATGDFVGSAYSGQGVTFFGVQTTTGFGETSQPNLAYNAASFAGFNVSGGFTAVSLTDGVFDAASLDFYSGANGTGSLLGSLSLTGSPSGFSAQSLDFSGTAFSALFNGNPGTVGIDDLNLQSAAPEPAEWALMLGGFGLAGAALRRRKAVAA
jgi:hypothetical protein